MTDGGLAGALAVHLDAVCGPVRGAGQGGNRSAAWLDLTAAEPEEHDRRRAAARRCTEACQLADLIDAGVAAWPGLEGGGLSATARLLAAGSEAIRLGFARVIWPVHLGGPGRATLGESAFPVERIEAIADATDRAVAAGRLLSIDAPGDGLSIETPFADLTDVQLADLAIEVDLPLGMVYLGDRDGPEMARWTRAFLAAGVPLSEMLTVTPIVRARAAEVRRAV